MNSNTDQVVYWNESAGPKWVANQARLDRLMAPLTETLLQEAVPQPGEQILDVGCGCGDVALQVAEAVRPTGHVVGIDISKPMLAHAASRATSDAARLIEWREADAMTADFKPTFDLLISRFGVMFFADKARAFSNLAKAMKPGGRIAFMAWRGRDELEWMRKPLEWIAPVLPPPDLTDGEVGPFGLADGEATRLLLEEVGLRDVICEPVDRELDFGANVDEAMVLLGENGAAAALMREADEGLREEARALLRRGLHEHAGEGRVVLRAACWIYRGVL